MYGPPWVSRFEAPVGRRSFIRMLRSFPRLSPRIAVSEHAPGDAVS
jgi:hypothetical protein